jgi:hypothetical protein
MNVTSGAGFHNRRGHVLSIHNAITIVKLLRAAGYICLLGLAIYACEIGYSIATSHHEEKRDNRVAGLGLLEHR